MTVEEIVEAWADLQAVRASQLAGRLPPPPSGRPLDLPAYLAAFGDLAAAIQRVQAAPTAAHRQAYERATAAWRQAQADLSSGGRAALTRWLGEGR
jgi:hypothetical protein